jgi:micrococcal nuclease
VAEWNVVKRLSAVRDDDAACRKRALCPNDETNGLLRFSSRPFGFLAAATAGFGEQLITGKTATAVDIIDGDTLVLDTGQQGRFIGLQAPKLPLGRSNFPSWPLADDSAVAQRELTKGKKLTLGYRGRRTDRHGRGMARVYSFADNRSLVTEMFAIEREARASQRGILAHPYYHVRDHSETPCDTESFQLVQGHVHAFASVREWTYVNCNEDWRHDITISVRRRNLKDFLSAGLHPTLEGRRIRVRGRVRWFNGPTVKSTHPKQIEGLDQ